MWIKSRVHRLGIVSLVLLQGCAQGYGHGQAPEAERWDSRRIDALVDTLPALMDRHAVPGVAVALVADGAIQWSAGFGVAREDGPDVTPSTIFQAASLGKPVFADVVRALEQREEWSLRDPLRTVAPQAGLDDRFLDLTVERLLSHSAGVHYDETVGRIETDPASMGTWQYSGTGYVLLQRALERSLREPLTKLAEDYLFRSAGMNRSSFVTPETGYVTVGHARDGNPLEAMSWRQPNAASSFHTSADDYARFLACFLSGLRGPVTEDPSLKPVVVVDEELGLYWGPGWALELQAGRVPDVFHWGSNPGFKSFALASPERGLGIVVLTNGDNGLELVEEAMEILDPVPHALFQFYMLHPDD